MQCKMSYIVCTRNRLPFLAATLPMLVDARQDDEEIVVIDGASTDGTVDYVSKLHALGDVDVFLSEPDRGEAHGLNKGCLLARGDLIKIVSDDDVFCFEAIHACRDYMFEHPEVDLMAGNVGHVTAESPADMSIVWGNANEHRRFRQGLIDRFAFNGLPLMLRRRSLPLLGLFATGVIAVDLEFTLRATGIACLGWCDHVVALRIEHGASNYRTLKEKCDEELRRLKAYHIWKPASTGMPYGARYRLRWARQRVRRPISTGKQVAVKVTGRLARRNERRDTQIGSAGTTLAASPEAMVQAAKQRLDAWHCQMPAAMTSSRARVPVRRPRVAMIPAPSASDWETQRDPQLQLLAQAIEAEGWDVVAVPRRHDQPDIRALEALEPSVVHLHRPRSLLEFSDAEILASATGKPALVHYAHRRVDAMSEGLKRLDVPIVWQVHDTVSRRFCATMAGELDDYLQRVIYALSDGLVLHEESCLVPVTELFGDPKSYAVSRLGDYSFMYGPACDRDEARSRLGLPLKPLVFAYVGTRPGERHPRAVLDAFCQHAPPEAVMLFAGMEVTELATRDSRRVVRYGRVRPSRMRDVFCAADFVVDDAERCLTSDVVRTAMSYSRPVLVRAFGSALDLARGASVTVDDDPGGIDRAIIRACAMTRGERDRLENEAARRNAERSWRDVGVDCVSLYAELTTSRSARDNSVSCDVVHS